MRLRAQVLVVGLATLVVPVLGWQSVRQLHASLQATRADAQTLAVANLRVAIAGTPPLVERLALGGVAADAADWYAETARWPLFVDGYADDWQELAGGGRRHDAATGDTSLALRVARRAGRLFLFVRVRDRTPVRHVPPRLPVDAGENEQPDPELLRANGDALEVHVRTPGGATTHALLSVIAPGPVEVVRARDRTPPGARLPRWRAEWVDDAGGYQVEIELPLPPSGSRVGIAAVDVDRTGGPRDVWAGSMSPRAMRAAAAPSAPDAGSEGAPEDEGGTGGRLFHESPAARGTLLPWVQPGTRARLYDRAGRLVADVDALYAPLPEGDDPPPSLASGLLDAILFRLFAWFAAGELPLFPETEKTRQPLGLDAARRALAAADGPPTTRYVTVDNDRVLGTLVPIRVPNRVPSRASGTGSGAGEARADTATGYLLFESNEEHASFATGSRLARLFALLLLTSLAVGTLLFAWATRLSLRIRRLSHEASRAVDADGRVGALAGSGARDEIGELARDLSALLARSAAYTRYLETLSSRLSHELGTPLSVVRTSLENVDRSRLDAESATLLARAGGGAERLGAIVRALVDSARLEQSVQHATFAPLEIRAWLEEAAAQYAQIHPGWRFVVTGSVEVPDERSASEPSGSRGARAPAGLGVEVASGRGAPPRRLLAHVSATLLQQALDKLVGNARDFAATPAITLVLARRGDGDGAHLVLAVGNRGAGIDAADREHLFEPSFSTRADTRDERGGAIHAGLGLHLVRLIAEAHGGDAFAADVRNGVVVGLRLPIRPPRRPVTRSAWDNAT